MHCKLAPFKQPSRLQWTFVRGVGGATSVVAVSASVVAVGGVGGATVVVAVSASTAMHSPGGAKAHDSAGSAGSAGSWTSLAMMARKMRLAC